MDRLHRLPRSSGRHVWTLPLAVALLGLLAADGRASPLELRFATKPLRFEPLPAPPDRPVYATLDAHLAETPAWEYRRKLVKARLTIDDPALAPSCAKG